jgi:hypothetical protein
MYDLYYGPNAIAPGRDGELDLVGYQVLLADMVERGQLDSPAPPPEKFVDPTYWQEARKSLP